MKRSPLKRRTPLRSKPKGPAQSRERNLPTVPAVAPKPRSVMALARSFATPVVPINKPETWRSEGWLAAVRSIPLCVRCRTFGVEPAHRNEGKGGGIKAHDCWTAALCRACHRAIDQGKEFQREDRRAEIDRCIVLTLAELVLLGMVAVVR